MSQLRIAVLNATQRDDNTTRNFRRELDASLSEFDVTDGSLPDGYEFDGAVVTGSRTSVYWDEPWIETTKEWVAEATDRGVPFLGVCWGHQLLADVLGGTVEDMGVYEVGYSQIERTAVDSSRLLEGIAEEFTAFTSHSDAVTELPPGATPLAENEYSNHGFRKDHVFGVQFHPEYDRKTARELVHRKELTDERRDSILAAITAENYRAACEAKLVFDNFLEFVSEGGATASATNADVETATKSTEGASTGSRASVGGSD
ncbi:type 1 glutamine amidotransferase [Natrialba swarupiae]|uniref:Type 1 glutamine amidotransferase n=1 Tax=Natrialba swarupiae TaxID=2448032 RepID=A0A5D5AS95_9EURY|nr:type 1 glutamine amidotransferase [Natrialba swarupiae]TYT63994.1 type 1 glutamine amidotransferase [Natrialba swarupiae]